MLTDRPDASCVGSELRAAGRVMIDAFAAASAASVEVADYALAHVEHLARVKRDAPDRADKVRQFAQTFAERAIRRVRDDHGAERRRQCL